MCKDFRGLGPEDFYLSWEGCMKGIGRVSRRLVKWAAPPLGSCKFNVDGAARGKPGPAGIGGVLHDDRGNMLAAFSESVGSMESNEIELRAIRRALQISSRFRRGKLIIESDSTNAISWANNRKFPLWRLIGIARDIWSLCNRGNISFIHTPRSDNCVADFFAKAGVHLQFWDPPLIFILG